MDYSFDFSFIQEYWPNLVAGVWMTVRLSLVTIVGGFVAGVLLAVGKVYGRPWLRRLLGAYVDLIRNTPLVVQGFWIFFGLAAMQVRIPALVAAMIALVINVSAYTTEIVRAGIESIPKGQMEAAECLGLSRRTMLLNIVLPQAVERMYPALVSQFVLMMLATSIMSQISVEELTGIGYAIQSYTFRGFEVYVLIAAIYLMLSWAFRFAMNGVANLSFRRRRRLGTPL